MVEAAASITPAEIRTRQIFPSDVAEVIIPAFRTADSLLWAERCDSLLPEQLDSGAGMSAAIGLRQDFDAGTLRRMAAQVKVADQARRLLALAAVYDGMS